MRSEYFILIGIGISSYLTYLGTTYKFRKTKPKDPTNELFNYYEQMLNNVWEQSKAKDAVINKLEESLNHIQQELWDTKNLLIQTKQQLMDATKSNEDIQRNITQTRAKIAEESNLGG